MDARKPSPGPSVFPGFGGAVQPDELVVELSAMRRERGLSQTQVAARMGTSQSAVARLEAGNSDARLSTLSRYAAAVGAELAFLVRDNEEDDS